MWPLVQVAQVGQLELTVQPVLLGISLLWHKAEAGEDQEEAAQQEESADQVAVDLLIQLLVWVLMDKVIMVALVPAKARYF
jgi:hypothetical protein